MADRKAQLSYMASKSEYITQLSYMASKSEYITQLSYMSSKSEYKTPFWKEKITYEQESHYE